MKQRSRHIFILFIFVLILAIPLRNYIRTIFRPGRYNVEQRLVQFGPAARARLLPDFDKVDLAYPPKKLVLVGLKEEKILEVWASRDSINFVYVKNYPILGASGRPGPKLREGDLQVPEGIYKVESLNPNSMFHLALRLNYPNEFDRAKAKLDGRTTLGGDIMIHGSTGSIGCLAMGDETAEDLFVLAAEVGIENISVILSPTDFRVYELPIKRNDLPSWTDELYTNIKVELSKLTKTD